MFMPGKFPGQPAFFPTPKANNQTLGWESNATMSMGFKKHVLGDKMWDNAVLRKSFVFLLKNTDLLPGPLSRRVRYNGSSVREKSVLLSLQQVNYLLAQAGDQIKTVDQVYSSVCPLGINTTAEEEASVPKPVMNVVVGGSVETTYNYWGNDYPAMAKAYFVIKKVYIKPNQSLAFVLSRTGRDIKYESGGLDGKYVYQIIPWVSKNRMDPMRLPGSNVEGFFQVGSIVQPSALKDVATRDKYDNEADRISRDMPEVVAKSRDIKMFVDIDTN